MKPVILNIQYSKNYLSNNILFKKKLIKILTKLRNLT